MNGRFFLDTNVFVYSFDESAQRRPRGHTNSFERPSTPADGIVSYQVVQEFFNVALRRFAHPMTIADAEQYLSAIFRPLMAVHSSPALYAQALHLNNRYRLSWYDSLIVASAIEGDCSTLYTEDLQHGQRLENLQIVNLFL